MSFEKIVRRVSDLAFLKNHSFASFPLIRETLKNKNVSKKILFSLSPKKGNYTFHRGGNEELQFNFGEDNRWIDGKIVFRYGIAFSIERNQHFLNPEKIFQPKIKIFNEFLSTNKWYFKDYLMYINRISKNDVERFDIVEQIKDKYTFPNTFIFIGKYFDKPMNKINDNDIEIMLETFDYLLEVYKYVESNTEIETRIARVCWNTNGWIKPSGKKGKSKSHSHEKMFGFGHEEWNFDTTKIIDGYKYGFIEPVQRNRKKYLNNRFDILLYTVNSETKTKYWVGKLNNVEMITTEESLGVYDTYKKRKWLKLMKDDLNELNLPTNLFNKYINESELFNIKFKPENIYTSIFEKPIPIESGDTRLKANWYVLYHLKEKNNADLNKLKNNAFNFDSGNSGDNKLVEKSRKKIITKEIELDLKHNVISDSFIRYLRNQYGKNATRECDGNGGGSVDAVVKTDNGNIFYEIKTYNHLKTSLRYAIGQLIEYATYPDKNDAMKFYLVSDVPPDDEITRYIKHLNKILSIPLGYIQYDYKEQKILFEI